MMRMRQHKPNSHIRTAASTMLMAASAVAQETIEATVGVGQATVGVAKVVTLENVPQATAQSQALPAASSIPRPQTGLTDEQWKGLKARAAKFTDPNENTRTANGPSAAASVLAPSTAPTAEGVFTPGIFRGFVAQNEDLFCSGVTPSDMALAVGQTRVVQVVNDCIAVYDKSTGALLAGYPRSLNAFLGFPANNFATGQFMSDPRAMYDFVANRFVVIALFEDFPNSRGFVGLAASQTSDPTGTWNVYQLQVGGSGQCPDYPTMGQNWANDPFVGAIYTGFNLFACGPKGFGGFLDDQVWFLPKKQIYAGQGFGFNFGMSVASTSTRYSL